MQRHSVENCSKTELVSSELFKCIEAHSGLRQLFLHLNFVLKENQNCFEEYHNTNHRHLM